MSESLRTFVDVWHSIMLYGSIIMLVAALLVIAVYYIRSTSIKILKKKYEFVSLNEVRSHRLMHFMVAIAIGMFLNTVWTEVIYKGFVLFFIRLSITVVVATVYGYVANLVMKYYYPTRLASKLDRIRKTPRINPVTGNTMRLLNEDEEDVYLDQGQQAEEDAFSVDYDVWIDTESGETHIEKYSGYLTAKKCDRCGFHTLKLEREEMVKESTDDDEGELIQYYKCSYCNRIKKDSKTIGKRDASSSPRTNSESDEAEFSTSSVTYIHVEIHGSNGEVINYEFQNTHQAETFFREFEFSKIESQ